MKFESVFYQMSLLSLVSLLGLTLLASGPQLIASRPIELSTFKGYLVDDEEMIGFWGCDAAEPTSFTDPIDIGVTERYWLLKKNIREPIYFEIEGVLSDDGGFGYGTGIDFEKNIEIHRIITAYRIEKIMCGALPFEFPLGWYEEA